MFLHSKSELKLLVFTPHQQTLASSNQRTFTMSDDTVYSLNLFTRNHKNANNLLVISLSETENLTLYLFHLSLIKSDALKTAGPDIHQCVNRIGPDSS
jgi:hypothetical protein